MAELRQRLANLRSFSPGRNANVRPFSPGRSVSIMAELAADNTDMTATSAATRDEMLDGLAKLRRDLESQRQQHTTKLVNSVELDKNKQMSAAESAIRDLQRDVAAQQACIADLSMELPAHKDWCQKFTAAFELALRRVCADVATLRDESKTFKLDVETQVSESVQRARAAAEEGAAAGAMRALPDALVTLKKECRSHLEAAQATLQTEAVACCADLRGEMNQRLGVLETELRLAGGHPQPALTSTTTTASGENFGKEIASIRQSMSTRASATDHKISELTGLTQEIVSELAILRGRLQAIGERPDLAAQIVASGRVANGTSQDDEKLRGRPSSPSSDSDISHLRPRSVSADRPNLAMRPNSAIRQFVSDSSQLLRSAEIAGAYADGGGQRGNDGLAGSTGWPTEHAALDTGNHCTSPRQGYLDVITEGRPSMERPSTNGSLPEARSSTENAEQ